MPQILENTYILKGSCPPPKKKFVLRKNKTHFLTFLHKMQFSAILCLKTCDWVCADRSHITT